MVNQPYPADAGRREVYRGRRAKPPAAGDKDFGLFKLFLPGLPDARYHYLPVISFPFVRGQHISWLPLSFIELI